MSEKKEIRSIVFFSLIFHALLTLGLGAFYFLDWSPKREEEPIWVELVDVAPLDENVQSPPPKPVEMPEPEPSPEPEPEVEPESEPLPPEPEPTPLPPEPKPVPKPSPKPAPKPKPAPTPNPKPPSPEPVQEKPEPTSDEWEMPDFEAAKAAQSLERVATNYKSRVVAAMSQYWRPGLDLNAPRGATVLWEIVILKNGRIGQKQKLKSSGNQALDQMAENALQLCRLPPLPPQLGNEWRLKYGFKYDPK